MMALSGLSELYDPTQSTLIFPQLNESHLLVFSIPKNSTIMLEPFLHMDRYMPQNESLVSSIKIQVTEQEQELQHMRALVSKYSSLDFEILQVKSILLWIEIISSV